MTIPNSSPHGPTKYLGPSTWSPAVVLRYREPTGADYRQPETGKLYPLNTFWILGKDPTNGAEGDVWYLSKIVANVAYWIDITSLVAIETVDGNSGTATPVANNINIVGTATSGINTVGSGDTLTLSMQSPYADGDFEFRSAVSGQTRTLSVTNTSNTASSQATQNISVAGTTAGDAWNQYTIGTTRSFAIGIDNSDANDSLKFTTAAGASVNPSTGTFLGAINPTTGGLEWGASSNGLSGTGCILLRQDQTVVTELKIQNAGASGDARAGIFLSSEGDSLVISSVGTTYFEPNVAGHAFIHDIGSRSMIIQVDSGLTTWSNTSATDTMAQINRESDNNIIRVINLTNATGNESAVLEARVKLSNQGDPYVSWALTDAAVQYVMGIDNTDDILKLNYGASPSAGSNLMKVSSAGEFNYPLQPAFFAYLATQQNDKTGNGAVYTLGTDALTEVFDQNGDFNVNGTFTAPVTGVYDLRAQVTVVNDSAVTTYVIAIVTTLGTYQKTFIKASGTETESIDISVLAPMTATNTATVTITVSGSGADDSNIVGSATRQTYFCGKLEA